MKFLISLTKPLLDVNLTACLRNVCHRFVCVKQRNYACLGNNNYFQSVSFYYLTDAIDDSLALH